MILNKWISKKIWGKRETNFTELDGEFKKKDLYQQYINVINNNDAGFIWERYVFTEYNNQGFMLKKNI
jgi:hypothetical protein